MCKILSLRNFLALVVCNSKTKICLEKLERFKINGQNELIKIFINGKVAFMVTSAM